MQPNTFSFKPPLAQKMTRKIPETIMKRVRNAFNSTGNPKNILAKDAYSSNTIQNQKDRYASVLLLTNDGEFTNLMTGPKHKVEKEYRVKMNGFLRKEESTRLCRGVKIDNYMTRKAKIKDVEYNKKSETTSATIIITEGKYHQVKKMFELVGHPVIKLKRVRFGFVDLKNLGVGEYRLLKPHEYKKLLNLVDTEE